MENKILTWVSGIGTILNIFNLYLSIKSDNLDATLGWATATCFSLSALGAYLKLINKNKEDEKI